MADPALDPASQTLESEPTLTNGLTSQPTDVVMADSSVQPEPSPSTAMDAVSAPAPTSAPTAAPPLHAQFAPSASSPAPTPAPVSLPAPVSSRNSPHPSVPAPQAPTQPIPHGSPTRVYLNQNVTPHLLEAMKHLATTEPDKPLKWLSEFLAQKSVEIEGP